MKIFSDKLKIQRRQCPHCPYFTVRADHLKRHIRTHTGEKPYSCEVCGRCFIESSACKKHMRRIHSATNEDIARFEKLHQCPHCPYSTKRADHLKRHIRTHTGEKPYSCEVCGRCFTESSARRKHIRRTHSASNEKIPCFSNKKLHQCPHCPYSAKKYSRLCRHIRTHTGEKPYSCEVCGQCFTRSSNLDRHMLRMHSTTHEAIHWLKL